MPSSGIDWQSPSRTLRNFFGRYGITGGSIRGLYNGLLPVAVVDRYRDDSEGSQFALTMVSRCVSPNYASFAMGSPNDDWELHGLNFGVYWPLVFPAVLERFNLMIYTPDFTYVPVETPNPPGLYTPGLNTDFAFTLSSVSGAAGYNSALPARWGFFGPKTSVTPMGVIGLPHTLYDSEIHFDPPIRVYRDVTLGMIVPDSHLDDFYAYVSARYTVRPRTTLGPRTG